MKDKRFMCQWRILTIHVMTTIAIICWVTNAWSGGMTAFFGPGDRSLPEVLSHLDNKALIVEFRDPRGSGIGKDLAFVLWRDLLSAISDQAGAGVIIARRPDAEPIMDLEKGEYHVAARRIAKSQRTWAAVWGSVEVVADKIFLETYVSLLPEVVQSKRLVQFYAMGEPIEALSANLPHSLFSFKLAQLDSDEVFHRHVVTRRKVSLHEGPDPAARIVTNVPPQGALEMTGMRAGWVKLRTRDGISGYAKMTEDSPIDILPRQVSGKGNRVNLRLSPDKTQDRNIIDTMRLRGTYTVLDRRYVPGQGTWYQVDVEGRPAWVAAWLVEERSSVPWIEFVAGLLRYGATNYGGAGEHFKRFIRQAPTERNVNLAAAYQLLGASLLRIGHGGAMRQAQDAFDAAVNLTPYDPNAHAITALANIGVDGSVSPAIPGLERALELDSQNHPARSISTFLIQVSTGKSNSPAEKVLHIDPRTKERLNDINIHYGLISPLSPPERFHVR